jgi:hypothetical protein
VSREHKLAGSTEAEREEEKKHAGERRAGDATEWGDAW